MKIDNSIIKLYLDGKPSIEYSEHWVYKEVSDGGNQYLFVEPDASRAAEVA